MKFLSQREATCLDQDLMSPNHDFTLDQLMELAGLSVAQAVHEVYHESCKTVLVHCGPGNNGGDGLVAARHLSMFGFSVEILIPVIKPKFKVFSSEANFLTYLALDRSISGIWYYGMARF